jgi:predicted nucleic-acid-binding protein
MVGIDTNILVRYLSRDDAKQSVIADHFVDGLTLEKPGYISHLVCVELSWVLESGYGLSREQIVEAFQRLLAVSTFQIERSAVLVSAVRSFSRSTADFADCLIERSAANAGCTATMTFDKKAARTGGMTLLI